MKPNVKKILIIAGLVIAITIIWLIFFHKSSEPVTVVAEKPFIGYIARSVTATGKIEPVDTVTVGTQISGIISSLYVNYNTKVKKGQLLARLDKSLLRATLDQYKGNFANVQSQFVFAQNNFNRQKTLFKADAISKADYQAALNTMDAAKGSVASVKAQIRSAEKNLSYADIYSPIDGVVLNRNVSLGQTVAASFSTPTLFVIAKDITKMEVDANVDEADIGDVKEGIRASFTVDAFINDQFGGIVSSVRLHPSVSANVVTYTTIISTANNDMKLKPGMTANIVIYTKEVNNAMLIPSKALSFVPDSAMLKDYQIAGHVGHKSFLQGSAAKLRVNTVSHSAKSRTDTSVVNKQKAFVWLLEGKKLIEKRIEIGLNDDTHVEVLAGLNALDLVVAGVSLPAKTAASAATPTASPFLPKRPAGGSGSRTR